MSQKNRILTVSELLSRSRGEAPPLNDAGVLSHSWAGSAGTGIAAEEFSRHEIETHSAVIHGRQKRFESAL